MPDHIRLIDLKNLCLNTIYIHTIKYSNSIDKQNKYKKSSKSSNYPKYSIGPCQFLSDKHVHFLLKQLYKYHVLNDSILFIFLHNKLKEIDLSFIINPNVINSKVCHFLRDNCYNITCLNLSGQLHLKPTNLCEILEKMKCITNLNLAYTQANYQVVEMICLTSKKLRFLNLKECRQVYEECVEKLADNFNETIEILNVESTLLSEETTQKILLKCSKLRCFNTPKLMHSIVEIFQRTDEYEYSMLNLDTVQIDTLANFNCEMMDALEFVCPELKSLKAINSLYSTEFLDRFVYLSELTLGNNSRMILLKFNELVKVLKGSLGDKLQSLQLILLPDINIQSISLYCKNLQKLRLELTGSYEPAEDSFVDLINNEPPVKNKITNLKYFSVSRNCSKYSQINLNDNLFRSHLLSLLDSDHLQFLELIALNEINDHFLVNLFFGGDTHSILVLSSVKLLRLINLNNLKNCFLNRILICANNLPLSVELKDCKNVCKNNIYKFNKFTNNVFT